MFEVFTDDTNNKSNTSNTSNNRLKEMFETQADNKNITKDSGIVGNT